MELQVNHILTDLDRVRENLLGLSDEIWLSIDHNDPDALAAGVAFKQSYNEKMLAYDRLSDELSDLIHRYQRQSEGDTDAPEPGTLENVGRERAIAELDRETPHTLDEDFQFKRPIGFRLDNRAFTGLATWRRIYEKLLLLLAERDPETFRALPETKAFISKKA
jgi:acyl-CoA-binding protein